MATTRRVTDPNAYAKLILAQHALRIVRDYLTSEGVASPQVTAKLRSLLKSVDGAIRNADRFRDPLESCPKCGAQVRRSKAFLDIGSGAEAGRKFYYCSERCRETH